MQTTNSWYAPLALRAIGCLALWLLPLAVSAYFLDAASGVRPAGMGGAFVSVANDSNTLLFNPAGLASLQEAELNGMYSDLYSNVGATLYTGNTDVLGYDFLAAAMPMDPFLGTAAGGAWGTAAFSWLHFNSTLYQENTWSLAYARNVIPKIPWLDDLALDLGATCQELQWVVAPGDYTPGEQKTGFTLGAGLLVKLDTHWRVGAAGDNLLPVDMDLEGTGDRVPPVWREGLTYEFPWPSLTSATLEASQRAGVMLYKFGLETTVLDADRDALESGAPEYQVRARTCRQ